MLTKKIKIKLLLLSILSGILLWLSWPPNGCPFVIFFAFIPLFFISDVIKKASVHFPFWTAEIYAFIAFFIWNMGTTWWIWNITPIASIVTFVLNSFFMSLFVGAWQRFRHLNLPEILTPLCFIAFWSTWEYLHLNWDLTWPWLNIGNVFANHTQWIQWYEYTGTFGGLLWILVANFLIFYLLKNIRTSLKVIFLYSLSILLWITLPMTGSWLRYHTYTLPDTASTKAIEAVIVQQNTDPVEEQYSMSNWEHAHRIFEVSRQALTPSTQLLVCPETAIPWSVWLESLQEHSYDTSIDNYACFPLFDSLLAEYPKLNIVIGMSLVEFYDTKATLTCQNIGDGHFVDSYNAACLFNKHWLTETYYKSKLVPGVEKMPYPQIFSFLEKWAIDLGGTSGSLGIDTKQRAFHLQGLPFTIGSPICYESAYGEHFCKFVRNGAQLMTVITNDGWWGDTPGYKQHLFMSKIRAVESRRTILRAANTGVSAIIDERGDAHRMTQYNTRCALRTKVCPNDLQTFYVRHGDYLARFFLVIAALLVICACIFEIRHKFFTIFPPIFKKKP